MTKTEKVIRWRANVVVRMWEEMPKWTLPHFSDAVTNLKLALNTNYDAPVHKPRDTAFITPERIAWACFKQKKHSEWEIANYARVPLYRLREWTRGQTKPTMNQVKRLAEITGVPFGAFWLPAPRKRKKK
jgi:hypothetical protein